MADRVFPGQKRIPITNMTNFQIATIPGFDMDSDFEMLWEGTGNKRRPVLVTRPTDLNPVPGKQARRRRGAVCDIKGKKRCPVQLRFVKGKTIIRVCDGKRPIDIPAADPVYAQNLAAYLCECRKRKKSFAACNLEKAKEVASKCAARPGAKNALLKSGDRVPCWPGPRAAKALAAKKTVSLPTSKRMDPPALKGASSNVCKKRVGTLSTEQRKRLPADVFALPGRRFPIPDVGHAKNAKARAWQSFQKGNLSDTEYNKVINKANAILRKCQGPGDNR